MEKNYDVAISFAGQNRSIAHEIALELKKNGVSVFYDDFEKSSLWGKDLYEHLTDVYKKKSKYCLMLLSEAYVKKAWTTLERRAAQARAFMESSEYILPLKLDDTEIPGINETIGYLDYRSENSYTVANLLIDKLWGGIKNDRGIELIKTQIEDLYMRAMLLCELSFLPDNDPKRNQQNFFPELYKKSIDMLVKLKENCQINSPLINNLALAKVTNIIKAFENILKRALFLFHLNDPKLKDFFFISEIPTEDFYLIYRFLKLLNVFDGYMDKSKRHFTPEEIINQWQNTEKACDRYSSNPADAKKGGNSIAILFNADTLRKYKGQATLVKLFDNL